MRSFISSPSFVLLGNFLYLKDKELNHITLKSILYLFTNSIERETTDLLIAMDTCRHSSWWGHSLQSWNSRLSWGHCTGWWDHPQAPGLRTSHALNTTNTHFIQTTIFNFYKTKTRLDKGLKPCIVLYFDIDVANVIATFKTIMMI